MSISIKLRIFLLFALFAIGSVGVMVNHAEAVTASDWRAGRIIDDNIFYTPGSMSATDIQNFLNSKVPVCDTWHAGSGSNQPPFTCLKDYSQAIPSVGADAYCSAINGGTFSAATLISKVSQACGINSTVLIVLLEKEQGLVTDTWPWSIQYRSATGYGCPDTAACDSKYYGFFNQVLNAAWQFKYYAANPATYRYKPFQNNTIQYNPNTSCGSSNVYIENRATAGLYNYTPYQPNIAALEAGYGEAPCGAYGNRNFWKLYNDWFGPSTEAIAIPFGNSTDIPITGDWDGNGKSSIGVWRSGVFYLRKTNGTFSVLPFGNSTDIPITGDWDGNGKSSIGVWRSGVFYLRKTNGTFSVLPFGNSTDIPITGDWDGNGKSSIGVWRSGVFYLRKTNGTFSVLPFGNSTDIPITGDWDGNGKSSIGVWRSGVFYLRKTNGTFSVLPFGNSTDIPITGDWDGNGKSSIGVWRSGVFYFSNY